MDTKQNFIALDLEMNQPSGKIIQVGISWGNLEDYKRDELQYREWLINPNEPISDEIIVLTGITDEMIEKKSFSFSDVVTEINALIDSLEPFRNYVVWGLGDKRVLETEISQTGNAPPGMGMREIDVKAICVFNNGYSKKIKALSLRTACNREKIGFIGDAHRADIDAYNTLRLFFELNIKRMQIEWAIETLKGNEIDRFVRSS